MRVVIMPYSLIQLFRAHHAAIRLDQRLQYGKFPSTKSQAAPRDGNNASVKIRFEASSMERLDVIPSSPAPDRI